MEKRTTEECQPGNRRGFLRSSSLLLAGAVPHTSGAASKTTHRIGLIGGEKLAVKASEALLREHPDAKLTALASPFPDLLQQIFRSLKGSTLSQVDVAANRRFQGTAAAFKLLDSNEVDHVVIAGPPAFRTDLALKSLHRGLRTTVLAPLATDLSQLSLFASGQLGLSVFPASCWPANMHRRLESLGAGALGRIETIQVTCQSHSIAKVRTHQAWSPYEASLRNWHAESALSGGPFLLDTISTFHLLLTIASVAVSADRSHIHGILPEPIRFSETAATRINSVSGESDVKLRSCLLSSGGIDIDFSWRSAGSGRPSGPGIQIIVVGERGSCDLCSKKKNPLDNPRSNPALMESPSPAPSKDDGTYQTSLETLGASRRVGAMLYPQLGPTHNPAFGAPHHTESPIPAPPPQPALSSSRDRYSQTDLTVWLEAHRLALSMRDALANA